MPAWFNRIAGSPALARTLPFILFAILTSLQGKFGESSRYWLYFAKTILGGWMLWMLRDAIKDMKWAFSWEAVAAGILVFVLWIGLDGHYPSLSELLAKIGFGGSEDKEVLDWNPLKQFSDSPALAWMFIIMRILGSTIVVPPLEEVFYRSFLYRYIAQPDFEKIALGKFLWMPFIVMCLLFGFAHFEWLAAILCAAIYFGLIWHKKRLGDAITAHAITNLLLGVWVVWEGEWHFW
jgi:CAAX prenyl protease-like protein